MTALWVALGAAVGAPLRFYLGRRLDRSFPVGTLAANTVSSLLLGLCVGWALGGSAMALLGTGFCGGLSTYSSLAVQTRDLGPGRGTAYAALTVALGLAAVSLGYAAATSEIPRT